MHKRFLPLLLAITVCSFAAAQAPQHLFYRVTVGSQFTTPVSGRLLIFLKAGTGSKEVDENPFAPSAVYVAAKEVGDLRAGESVDVDTDDLAFPAAFSTLKPGDYEAQAVLDVHHGYNYDGREAGDLVSEVVPLTSYAPGVGAEPLFTLNAVAPGRPSRPMDPDAEKNAHLEDFVSAALTAFSGRDIHVRAWVITPPDYDAHPRDRYPTVYWTHGFGGDLAGAKFFGGMMFGLMKKNKLPAMIWVMLDESCPTGTHEFANSVNDGPWGTALTTEYIPYLEKKYRMDVRPSGRFLQGHSSGGWATLQLQIDYPTEFGGTWSTSPDPSDFHDFTGIDLYAPHANVYKRSDGTAYPLIRDHGKVLGTFDEFARNEQVLGAYGGQIASFEWVFSPRGRDGQPEKLFDRATGDVDPAVIAYWHDHFDLAHIVQSTWAERGRDLRGKIHVFVGTADTFYLDGAAHKMDAVLKSLNADAHFTYIPNRTHFDLYSIKNGTPNGDRFGLFTQIGAEMYAVARPHANWKAGQ
ncbi:MAG TPA: alpha/beta hydrolase-fold protein [Terracidiphilus sp.]|jgi:hypothetical protein